MPVLCFSMRPKGLKINVRVKIESKWGQPLNIQSWANYCLKCNPITNYWHECNWNYKLLWNQRPNYFNYKLHAIANLVLRLVLLL